MTQYNMTFNDLAHMARYIKTTPKINNSGSLSTKPANEWNANMSYADALDICLTKGGVYQPALDAMQKIELELPSTLNHAPARRPTRSMAGSRPHVAAFCAGSQKAMMRTHKKDRYRPAVKIAVDVTNASQDDQYQMFNRGVAILSAIRQLEASGRQVELHAYMYSTYGGDNLLISLPIKTGGHRVSLADISFLLAHVCVTRRIYTAVVERHPEFYPASKTDYGRVSPLTAERANGQFDVIIPAMNKYHESLRSAESARIYISELIKVQLDQKKAA